MSNSCNLKMAGEAVSSKSTGHHHHHHHQLNRDPYMACKRATPVANGLPKPTFEYIIGTKGALSCNGTDWSMPSQTDCLEHATKALTAAGKTARRGLQVGNWGHLPWGCSVQSGGDWSPHYNRKDSTRNDGGYSPVCGREIKATNEIQTGTSFLQATQV